MPYFLVSYDLNTPGQNYSALYKELERYPAYWHYINSTWIIYSDKTAIDIAKHLRRFIDDNDQLIVVILGNDWASINFPSNYNDWLLSHLQ